MSNKDGWIGVDLDGTLAEYHGWVGVDYIGAPIPEMVERVKQWLGEGKDVRIFTARVDGGTVALSMGNKAGELFKDIEKIKAMIQDWTEKHIGVRLPVTNIKDYGMIELWDDRYIQVIRNTGKPITTVLRDELLIRSLTMREEIEPSRHRS